MMRALFEELGKIRSHLIRYTDSLEELIFKTSERDIKAFISGMDAVINAFELRVIHAEEVAGNPLIERCCPLPESFLAAFDEADEPKAALRTIEKQIKQVRAANDFLREFFKVRRLSQQMGFSDGALLWTPAMKEFIRHRAAPCGASHEWRIVRGGGHSKVFWGYVNRKQYVIKEFDLDCRDISIGEAVYHSLASLCNRVMPLAAMKLRLDGTVSLLLPKASGTVLDRIIRKGNLSDKQCLIIAYQLIQAVNAIYRKKRLIHGDLKPGNIVLDDRRLKLIDFGFTLKEGETGGKCTPEYNAPERGYGMPITRAMDAWSIGAIIYEVVARETLFSRRVSPNPTVSQRMMDLARNPYASKRDPGGALRTLAGELLSPDPSKRPDYGTALQKIEVCFEEA